MSDKPAKKKKYLIRFNGSWSQKINSFQNLEKDKNYALCIVCGENDISKHNSKHKQFFDSTQNQKKITDWSASTATASSDQKVTKSELFFAGFLVEHNLPIATANHACKLFCAIFPDLKLLINTKLIGQRLLTC